MIKNLWNHKENGAEIVIYDGEEVAAGGNAVYDGERFKISGIYSFKETVLAELAVRMLVRYCYNRGGLYQYADKDGEFDYIFKAIGFYDDNGMLVHEGDISGCIWVIFCFYAVL